MDQQGHNAADPKKVKAASKKEARGRDREIEDLRFVLGSPQGKRVIWKLLVRCRAFASVFSEGHGTRMAYACGQQDVGHFLLDEIQAVDPNKLIEMMIQEKEDQNG